MDELLKRRLVGAAVISGLAVLIVPQFFEDKSPAGSAGLPQPLELPRQTNAAPAEAGSDSQSAPRENMEASSKKRKYEVVPLDDAPAAAPHAATANQDAAVSRPPSTGAAAPEATLETPAYRDEDAEAPAPLIKPRAASSRSSQSAKSKPVASKSPAEAGSVLAPAKKARASTAETPVPSAAPKPKVSAKTTRTEASSSPNPTKTGKTAKPVVKAGTSRTVENPTPKPSATAKREGEKPAKKTDVAASGQNKPAATKSAKGSSWTVQAGTFADESNAKKLAEKLKKSGLPVKVHPAEGSNGKVYRVTVGSSLDRSRAEKVQKNLSSQHGVKGMMLENR
ncbi:MAG: hypothetical protein EHM62_01990 [Methylococcus sp.]|nr:MAG: hypothetical protein EHM62_01990 [Methylococcus sp.]